MDNGELLLISIGLAMDAFAVSLCKGLSFGKVNVVNSIVVGLYFGIFQALMPSIGYFLGDFFAPVVVQVDHWITFILLTLIGTNMLKESNEEDKKMNSSICLKAMLLPAIATSIDAMAVGITFAFLEVNLIKSVCFIGIISFILSTLGSLLGSKIGMNNKVLALRFGGVVLIMMGTKILIEHLIFL